MAITVWVSVVEQDSIFNALDCWSKYLGVHFSLIFSKFKAHSGFSKSSSLNARTVEKFNRVAQTVGLAEKNLKDFVTVLKIFDIVLL